MRGSRLDAAPPASDAAGPVAVAAAALALVTTLAPPAAAHHHAPVQPGAEIAYPGPCTLGFVLEAPDGTLYVATAAHCVDGPGQAVIPDGLDRSMGRVAWTDARLDAALVRVDAAVRDQVDPRVRHWGGPTGVAAPADTAPGDAVRHYGHGAYYRESELTRPRAGVLTGHGERAFCAHEPVYGGDSGSPVLAGDGRALGIASRIGVGCTPPAALTGPTVSAILDAAAEDGITVELATAPPHDALPRETARACHVGPACTLADAQPSP